MIRALAMLFALAIFGAFVGVVGSRAAHTDRLASTARSSDQGLLETFAPRSATTWWAIVESNLHARTFVVRTSDSGHYWRDVTPSVKLVASSDFLGTEVGWVEADALFPPRTEPLYRTLDGGRSWQRLARVPTGCRLDFVDERHGWCADIGAASGSSTVRLYRTSDGGSSWTLVSRTGLGGANSTTGALPYGCDKTITFTSQTVGWASGFCAGGSAYLYRSSDGGSRWQPLARIPLPGGIRTDAGVGLSPPVVTQDDVAVAVEIGGNPGATAIAVSTTAGRSWRIQLVPGPREPWRVDLIDTEHWRLSNGTTLLATNDAGRNWRSWKSAATMKNSFGTSLVLNFLSPSLGFAVPDANGGPIWSTRDGGKTWLPIRITAGPYSLPG